MALLTEYPWSAAIVAVICALLWHWRRRRIAGIAAGAWGLYTVYEYLMLLRVLCSGECNIRIDLLVIHPVLALLALAALVTAFMRRGASDVDVVGRQR